jgi:hypothetical protein
MERLRSVVLAAVLLLPTSLSFAQDDDSKPAPPLPTDKTLWLNTTPLTWDQLRGKGVCLYFFEVNTEGVELLPKFMESAKTHALDPVIFIGVAMGSDRNNTEQFLRNAKFNLPTLCDPTYTYARLCDTCVGTEKGDAIADSACAMTCVTPKGKMFEGLWDSPDESVPDVLEEAKWTVDPKEIPEPLRPVWKLIEIRKYVEVLPSLKKSLSTGPEPQRAAAKTLQDSILAEIERLSTEARTADEADEKWKAYRLIAKIEDEFRGYEIPKDLDALEKKLMKSPQVKAGITAEKQLPSITQNLTSPNPSIRKKAQSQLEKIKSDFPDTDLAERAQVLLDSQPSK